MNNKQVLTLHCLECNWQVQVTNGTPVSALRSDCLICKGNVGIHSGILALKESDDEGTEIIQDDMESPTFLPEYTIDSRIIEGLVEPEESDESFLIDSFVNRITPLVLAAKVVAKLKQKNIDNDDSGSDIESILDEFAEQGIALRNYIRKHEQELGISGKRASGRLSVGFPEEGSKSLKVFVNTFLGGEHGLAKKLGAIRESDDDIELTTSSKHLLDMKVLERINDVKLKKHGKGIREVFLPEWYTSEDVKKILTFINERAQSETGWMQEILGQASRPGGRTHSDIMKWEHRMLLEGKSPRKWKYSDLSDSESENELFDEDFYKNDKLAKEIHYTLKGTLNRLKELGLIYSFKKGRQTYYRPTNLGFHWVQEWDRNEMN